MAELDEIINEPSEAEKRIKQLSDKARSSAEERDAEKSAREAAEARASEAERNAQFAEGFADALALNPSAKDFKDDIRSKVMAGYSVEDATFAVLGKAGKLGTPVVETPTPAGGSSPTALPQDGGQKSIAEMTQTERRTVLEGLLDVT